jgi:small subunit ribosomal protein S1
LGDPWAEVPQKYPAGSVIEGPVTSFTKFGAFVQISEGVEGMIYISEISSEKRIHHPQDALKLGQQVRAQVLEVDPAKRQLRLSMKKLVPVSIDEYLAEHKQGDVVTGRLIEVSGSTARVELGEGIEASSRVPAEATAGAEPQVAGKADLSSLTSMLQARWKGTAAGSVSAPGAKPEPARAGQIRTFRITKLDPAGKKVELELL